MKTLHLINAWHARSGGIGTFYRALLAAGNRERQYVRLVVPGDSTHTEDVGEFGRIYTIRAPRAPFSGDYRVLYPHRFLFPNTAIQCIINDERPNLIEFSEKYTLPYLGGLVRTGRLPGVRVQPTVVAISHERMDENMAAYLTHSRYGLEFCRWYMKWIYFPMADHHIAVSEHTAAELMPASHGHKVRRGVWILPMGVDASRFTPSLRSSQTHRRLLARVGADENTTLLLYAGRLAPEKNLGLLIQTMNLLRDEKVHLLIVGEGMARTGIERQCEDRRLPVSFLGHVADSGELATIYANSDIFLHPNPREPFGIAPLEAMAAGLALVAPNSGGVIAYASQENAWLGEPEGNAFARNVRAVLGDPESRRRKTAHARETALQYDWPIVTSRYLTLYRELHAAVRDQHFVFASPARLYSTAGDAFGREI